jgi:hypothetical protein
MGTSDCFVYLVFVGYTCNVWESGMLLWHHTDSVRHINEHLCINCIDYTSHMFSSSEKLALFMVLLKTSRSYWDGLYAVARVTIIVPSNKF